METMKAIEMKDTVAMMLSEDYKERFRAEYYQTRIRKNRLHEMCVKYEAGLLDFEPNCTLALLREQEKAMEEYLFYLEARSAIEGVVL